MLLLVAVVAALALIALGAAFVRSGTRWGSTPEERAERRPGDEYLCGGPSSRVVMTRAISIEAAPGLVWPWLAQLGRGAGFYSLDRLDNGGRRSARHIVSWRARGSQSGCRPMRRGR